MKILVVGSGGREHALAWRLSRDGHEVVCAPGNPGMTKVAECLPIEADELDLQVALARDREVDLVVVGPEAPLVSGLADKLRAAGIACFGPGADAARLEGSKAFSKHFFARHGIRSARFFECSSVAEIDAALAELGDRVVVKADGLAAGKGVAVCSKAADARVAGIAMVEGGRFGDAGRRVVIEERLAGKELSVMAIADGKRYVVLAQAEDHKAVFDGDRGPNTGGMGTVSPAPWATDELLARVRSEIFDPTLAGLAADGLDFRGVLYAGIMVADDGTPWILEYNVRFGDPETQPILMRLRGDLGAWLGGAARGELPAGEPEWDPRSAVCVVLGASGYPGKPRRGDAIRGLDGLDTDDLMAFHAGTAADGDRVVTAGGRVVGVTALGDDLEAARARAYSAAERVRFRGVHYRRDIGVRESQKEQQS